MMLRKRGKNDFNTQSHFDFSSTQLWWRPEPTAFDDDYQEREGEPDDDDE